MRKFILEGKKAVEGKNIFSCASLVAGTYHDKYGNDRQSLIYIAQKAFSYYTDILIRIEKMEINLSDNKDSAQVEITALVLCKLQDNSAENIFQKEKGRLRVKLVKEEKKWRLQEIEFIDEFSIMGQKIN